MSAKPLFTVFTATFNRAHTLPGVYESLINQTCRDLEWVIVDDGSTDNTAELVLEWQRNSEFPIRYCHQQNRGKHVAFNRGVAEARGKLFVTLDSDDICCPTALATFKRLWEAIPFAEQDRFANITGLCVDDAGSVVGQRFPADLLDAYSPADQIRMRSLGEKWGINRTDVLRQFPFPVIRGEKWVPEALVWNRISAHYAARFVNEPVRVYRCTRDALSAHGQLPLRVHNPHGASLYYQEAMMLPLPLARRFREAVNYCRFSFHAGARLARLIPERACRSLTVAAAPLGYVAYLLDRRRLRAVTGNTGQ